MQPPEINKGVYTVKHKHPSSTPTPCVCTAAPGAVFRWEEPLLYLTTHAHHISHTGADRGCGDLNYLEQRNTVSLMIPCIRL